MSWNRSFQMAAALVCVLTAASPANAGLTDAIKKKISDNVGKKIEGKADKAMGDTETATPAKGESAPTSAGSTAGGSKDGKVSSVSTKFDYVPGDNVMFLDDFRQDELGEFPAKWRLVDGTFEVAELDGERWLRCTSTQGHVRMKVPASLPEFWTLEFDLYNTDPGPIALNVLAKSAEGGPAWEARFPYSGNHFEFQAGKISSMTPVEGTPILGRHHLMFMARGTGLKAYVDRERVLNVPDATEAGKAVELELRLGAPSKPMIANVRFAEGCRPAKDMLATGKLVTYGIKFETGSDVVLPESAPILRQVAAYMEANQTVKLKITGHTDNVGSTASNLDLSKRRAGSVAAVLSSQLGIGADRFETAGQGDTQPVSSNGKPEGRAMNRRVEFAKL